jgi:bud site selection protein 20
MTRTRNKRSRTPSKKCYKKQHDTKRRRRDIDQIQDDIEKAKLIGAPMTFEADDDLPGLGQFYCTPCGRHFADQVTLEAHEAGKLHKRRWLEFRIICRMSAFS